jgi:hypothetical protein
MPTATALNWYSLSQMNSIELTGGIDYSVTD